MEDSAGQGHNLEVALPAQEPAGIQHGSRDRVVKLRRDFARSNALATLIEDGPNRWPKIQYPWVLDFGPTIRAILDERRQGVATGEISAKFHNTIAASVLDTCRFLRGQRDLKVVALSGGVFQNELLLRRTVEALQSRHFRVFTNTAVPLNDGGLALGQAAVAAERTKPVCV